MMATLISVSTDRGPDGQVVVTAIGELDMSNVDRFNDAVAAAVALTDGAPVDVDLTGVEYLDSAAINALFGYTDRIRLLANPILMPVLKVSGLTDAMSVAVGG